jgi:hypothetical protein
MQDPFWRESVNWSEELELRYSCPLRRVNKKGMRSRIRKLTTPKLIKRQLEEIAQDDSDSTPNMVLTISLLEPSHVGCSLLILSVNGI